MQCTLTDYTAFKPEIEQKHLNKSEEQSITPVINISEGFRKGKCVFQLDGMLVLDFEMLSKYQGYKYDEYNGKDDENADNVAKEKERRYKSNIVFVDKLGKKAFIIQINPFYSLLTLKSDYKKVSVFYLLSQVNVCCIIYQSRSHEMILFLSINNHLCNNAGKR